MRRENFCLDKCHCDLKIVQKPLFDQQLYCWHWVCPVGVGVVAIWLSKPTLGLGRLCWGYDNYYNSITLMRCMKVNTTLRFFMHPWEIYVRYQLGYKIVIISKTEPKLSLVKHSVKVHSNKVNGGAIQLQIKGNITTSQ